MAVETGTRRSKLGTLGMLSLLLGLSGAGWVTWHSVFDRDAIGFAGSSRPVEWATAVPGLRLHVFETGRMVIPGWTVAHGGNGERVMDQPAYLIEHPKHGLVMFEAGHHSDISKNAGEHLGWIHAAGLMPMEQEPGQSAREQLSRAGFSPDAVGAIIVSHFHPEHVGAVEEFPSAQIVADAREIEHGLTSPDYNYVRREYDEVPRWKRVEFRPGSPFGPFSASFDLFGDGSVVIVSTPGHTPGHVSVAVNLPQGPVLLAGDAAWTEQNIESRSIGLPFVSSDGMGARVSLGQVIQFCADNPYVLVVPGHDLSPLRRTPRADVVMHPWEPQVRLSAVR